MQPAPEKTARQRRCRIGGWVLWLGMVLVPHPAPGAAPAESPAPVARIGSLELRTGPAGGWVALDPADHAYRRAPMAEAVRSLVLPLEGNANIAFDTDLLRVHTAWRGPRLGLQGPPYTGVKTPFLAVWEGELLWQNPPLFPWQIGNRHGDTATNRPTGARFRAISTATLPPVLEYELPGEPTAPTRVRETFRSEAPGPGPAAIWRTFEIEPHPESTLAYLLHVTPDLVTVTGGTATLATGTGAGTRSLDLRSSDGGIRLRAERVEASYTVPLTRERGTQWTVEEHSVRRDETRVWLTFPPATQIQRAEVRVGFGPGRQALGSLPPSAPRHAPAAQDADGGSLGVRGSRAGPHSAYRLERLVTPPGLDLLVGGMDFTPTGDLVVCTWPGEIVRLQGVTNPTGIVRHQRLAGGLNEPLGLRWETPGGAVVVQKGELTRLEDSDGNGDLDRVTTLEDRWSYSGSYHAFAFGPIPAPWRNGGYLVGLCGAHGRWFTADTGWILRVDPGGGTLQRIASGFRSPNGLALFGPASDLFATDNQGEWVGTCKLVHVREGEFYGFPAGGTRSEAEYANPPPPGAPPAVWFPRHLSASASDIAVVKGQSFGPYEDQMIIADWQNALLMRVALERVDGEWQGAVWPFVRGLAGAPNRLKFGPDGHLYIGGCKRTWPSSAPVEGSLERLRFEGESPFDVLRVEVVPGGFELEFTQACDLRGGLGADTVAVSQFGYRRHAAYGSPEIDFEGRENRASPLEVTGLRWMENGRKLGLEVKGLREGYVTRIELAEVRSAGGKALASPVTHYTLNRIPKVSR